MAEPERLNSELSRLDLKAYQLYKICRENSLRSFAEDLAYLLSTFRELQRLPPSLLRGSAREPERLKLQYLYQGVDSTLRRLDIHLIELFGPRDRPPPPIREAQEIQTSLSNSRKALIRWVQDSLENADKAPAKALPYLSPPNRPKHTPPSSSGEASPAKKQSPSTRPVENLHKRATSYGGVPLTKSSLGANLKPEVVSSSDEGSSRKALSSPYQPTVEEVPDEGTVEEEHSGSFVDSYHMDPPGSSLDQHDIRPSNAAQVAAATLNREEQSSSRSPTTRTARDGKPRSKRPSFNDKRSYDGGDGFLKPNDAMRRPSGGHHDSWSRMQEDFSLYSDTEDEVDDIRSGSRTAYRVEPSSVHNTPRETAPMPSPYIRRTSFARSPLSSDARMDFRGPNHSPMFVASQGPSPRPRPKDYDQEARRYSGVFQQEVYSGRPSPLAAAESSLPMRRPRAYTASNPSRYSMYAGVVGDVSSVDFKDMMNSFAQGRADSFERQFHTTDKPKPVGASKSESTPALIETRPEAGAPSKVPVREYKIAFTLEEFYKGATRKMKITGRSQSSTVLDVPLAAGSKPGSIIKYSNIELNSSNAIVGDLHFLAEEKPHPMFERKGDDLHATLEIPLVDSLCGWERNIRAICGTDVRVRRRDPTPPGWQECYAGLGMTKHGRVNQRGDLYVGVKIIYPPALSEEKRQLLREILRA